MACILLIDDDPQILKLHSTYLELEGHSVVLASNGKVGIHLLTEENFDVVVTDIIMPESDGLEVLMSQMRLQNRPKIIAITGGSAANCQDYLLNTARLLKADLALPKPLELSALSRAVEQLTA